MQIYTAFSIFILRADTRQSTDNELLNMKTAAKASYLWHALIRAN